MTKLDPPGYLSCRYAASLAEFGRQRALTLAGGWLLERMIPGSPCRDAIGCYPLFCCRDWQKLSADFNSFGSELVSIALVTDPFGEYDEDLLRRTFDRVLLFKSHHIIDFDTGLTHLGTKHHRYYARRALRNVAIEVGILPCHDVLSDWIGLYANLIRRHGLKGIKAFSPECFREQLSVPGLVIVRASEHGSTVGAHLWYVQGDVAYSHLAAQNDRGYQLSSAYAMYAAAIEYFRGKVRWLDLGTGAGTTSGADEGLSLFKRGWATGTRAVYFCGRTLNPSRYEELVARNRVGETSYYPAYRNGELA